MGTKILVLLCGLSILQYVAGAPTRGTNQYKRQHCVRLTAQNEEKIGEIINKLSDYLYSLQVQYKDFDIRLVKIDIEGHSDEEDEEKETNVQLVVNDCGFIDDSDEDKTYVKEYKGEEDSKEGNNSSQYSNEKSNESQIEDREDENNNISNNSYENETAYNSNSEQTDITDNESTEIPTVNSKETEQENVATSSNTQTNVSNNDQYWNNENDEQTNPGVRAELNVSNNDRSWNNQNDEQTNPGVRAELNVSNNDRSWNNQNDEQTNPGVRAELNLDEEGQKLLDEIEKKRGKSWPLLFYAQNDSVLFFNKL